MYLLLFVVVSHIQSVRSRVSQSVRTSSPVRSRVSQSVRTSSPVRSRVSQSVRTSSPVRSRVLQSVRTSSPGPIYFKGAGHILSNFYLCTIVYKGMSFPSSEHLYQYRKTVEHSNFHLAEQIRHAETASEVKKLSKFIKSSQNWFRIKLQIMFEITDLKYHQCQKFRNYLLGTGER